jgi:hypothetical protein
LRARRPRRRRRPEPAAGGEQRLDRAGVALHDVRDFDGELDRRGADRAVVDRVEHVVPLAEPVDAALDELKLKTTATSIGQRAAYMPSPLASGGSVMPAERTMIVGV